MICSGVIFDYDFQLTFGLEAWRGARTCGKTLHRDVWLKLDLKHWLRSRNHRWVKLDWLHPCHGGHRELRRGKHGAKRVLREGGQEYWGGLRWLWGENGRAWSGWRTRGGGW